MNAKQPKPTMRLPELTGAIFRELEVKLGKTLIKTDEGIAKIDAVEISFRQGNFNTTSAVIDVHAAKRLRDKLTEILEK